MTKVNTDDDFDFGLPALALPPFSLAAFALPSQSHLNARRICWQNPFIQFYAQAGKKVAKRKYKTFLLTINGSMLRGRGVATGGTREVEEECIRNVGCCSAEYWNRVRHMQSTPVG